MRAAAVGRGAWGPGLGSTALAFLAAMAGTCCAADVAGQQRVVDLGGGAKMNLVLIPAGAFTMGSTEAALAAARAAWPKAKDAWFADEKPAHKVTLSKPFWMGTREVTVGQFRRFVEATGYKTDAEKGTKYQGAMVIGADGEANGARDASWRNPYYKQTDAHPVVCVSWIDARAFADWLNATDKARPAGMVYRLPTEAQWEYACRAGTTGGYQWGDDPAKGKGWCNGRDVTANKTMLCAIAFPWFDGFTFPAPVGSFKANAFGLYDMHGNVMEWCRDCYGPYAEASQTDPTGPAAGPGRVLRGGAWDSDPWALRSADRYKSGPEARGSYVGFRLVLATGG